jgi:hypothetical protein
MAPSLEETLISVWRQACDVLSEAEKYHIWVFVIASMLRKKL